MGLTSSRTIIPIREAQSKLGYGVLVKLEEVAAMTVDSMPWTMYTVLLMDGVRFIWMAVIALAAFGSIAAWQGVVDKDGTYYPVGACHDVKVANSSTISCECNGESVSSHSACQDPENSAFVLLFLCVSSVWGNLVINNVASATVAGSVASWWFSPSDDAPVRKAFHRATHDVFGSLCKAAAISSSVRLLRMALRHLPRIHWCPSDFLSWAQNIVDYVLQYTICFVGIYGLSLSEARSRVGRFFWEHGATMLANDPLVSVGLLMLGCVAMLIAVVVVFIVESLSTDSFGDESTLWPAKYGPCMVGLYVYMTVVFTVLRVIRTSFKSVLVCFIQDPEALAANHDRQLHDSLSKAWEDMNVHGTTNGVRGDPQA